MQEILEAIVQGIVQGATEFLPVSSSGHLSLAQHFMGVQNTSLLFNVMLHIGTLAAVVLVYRKLIVRLFLALISLVRDIFTGKFKWSAMDPDRNLLVMLIIGLVPLFLLFLPVPGTGMKVKDYADLWGTDSTILVEGGALLVTSALLLIAHLKSRAMAAKAEEKARTQGKTGKNCCRTPPLPCCGCADSRCCSMCGSRFPGAFPFRIHAFRRVAARDKPAGSS